MPHGAFSSVFECDKSVYERFSSVYERQLIYLVYVGKRGMYVNPWSCCDFGPLTDALAVGKDVDVAVKVKVTTTVTTIMTNDQ